MIVLFINFKVIPRLSPVLLRCSSERVWLTNVKFPQPLLYIFWTATARSWQGGEKTGHNTAICSGFILSSWYRLETTCVRSLERGKPPIDRGQMGQFDVASPSLPRPMPAVGVSRNQKCKKRFFDFWGIICDNECDFKKQGQGAQSSSSGSIKLMGR